MNVDVVVVSYQSASLLPECVQTLPSDVSVVVVDNASTDGSADVAAALGVRVLRNQDNAGFARAANQGAAEGNGELILFLNPDARIKPAELEKLVNHLDRDPTQAVVGPRLVGLDGTEQRAWWPFPTARRAWVEAFGGLRLAGRRLDRTEDGFVVGACLLIRRSVFEALRGFDERFWLYGEEADLCWRVRDLRLGVALVLDAVAVHIGGASGMESPEVVFEHFSRGSEIFVEKHAGPPSLLAYRLAVLTGSILRIGVLRAAGRGGSRVSASR
ncbi:MAG: glycosyltransferase family 2 protein, partial [Actinobacteria bacterium]|nr:glycosyltransferase family 2 protein [Actinomycetota bacterium]